MAPSSIAAAVSLFMAMLIRDHLRLAGRLADAAEEMPGGEEEADEDEVEDEDEVVDMTEDEPEDCDPCLGSEDANLKSKVH